MFARVVGRGRGLERIHGMKDRIQEEVDGDEEVHGNILEVGIDIYWEVVASL